MKRKAFWMGVSACLLLGALVIVGGVVTRDQVIVQSRTDGGTGDFSDGDLSALGQEPLLIEQAFGSATEGIMSRTVGGYVQQQAINRCMRSKGYDDYDTTTPAGMVGRSWLELDDRGLRPSSLRFWLYGVPEVIEIEQLVGDAPRTMGPAETALMTAGAVPEDHQYDVDEADAMSGIGGCLSSPQVSEEVGKFGLDFSEELIQTLSIDTDRRVRGALAAEIDEYLDCIDPAIFVPQEAVLKPEERIVSAETDRGLYEALGYLPKDSDLVAIALEERACREPLVASARAQRAEFEEPLKAQFADELARIAEYRRDLKVQFDRIIAE